MSASPLLTETLEACRLKQRAQGYRDAAAELMERMERAEDLEREARQKADIAAIDREANRELDHGARYLRGLRGKG